MSSSASQKAAATLVLVAAGILHQTCGSTEGENRKQDAAGRQTQILQDWPTPQAVFVFSGQQHGYLEPCGCSPEFQKGGLARRLGFIKSLQQKKWPVITADLGGLLEDPARQPVPGKYMDGPEHAKIKLETALDALHQMKCEALNLAPEDLAVSDGFLGLMGLIGNLDNPKLPRAINANLGVAQFFIDDGLIFPHITREVGGVKIAIVGMLGEHYKDRVADQDLKWQSPEKVLGKTLNQIKPTSDLQVLMLYGTIEEARQLAIKFPDLDVIIHASDSEEPNDRPEWVTLMRVKPAKVSYLRGRDGKNVQRIKELEEKTKATIVVANDGTVSVISANAVAADETAELLRVLTKEAQVGKDGNTMLVTIGVKGKNAAAIGIFKSKPRLRFELVPLDDRFDEDQGIRELLDKTYIDKLEKKNLVANSPKVACDKANPALGFVGSKKCGDCHQEVYKFWQTTRHSHALETLVNGYEDPKTRKKIAPGKHVNPDCVSCHTTGFFNTTGYNGTDATKHLGGNGCENCHGPGSDHVKIMSGPAVDKEVFDRAKKSMHLPPQDEVNNVCKRCHDAENSPRFRLDPFWEKVEHGTPADDDKESLAKIREKLLNP